MMDEILGPLQELKLEDTLMARKPSPFADQEELWDVFQQAPPARKNYIHSLLMKTAMEASTVSEQPEAAPDDQTDPSKTEKGDNKQAEEQVKPAGGSTGLCPTPSQSYQQPTKASALTEKSVEVIDDDKNEDNDGEEGEEEEHRPPPTTGSKKRPLSFQSSHQLPPKRAKTNARKSGEGLLPTFEAMTLKHQAGGGANVSVAFSMSESSGCTLNEQQLDALGMLPPQDGSAAQQPSLEPEPAPQGKTGSGKPPTPLKEGKPPASSKKQSTSKVTPTPKTGEQTFTFRSK